MAYQTKKFQVDVPVNKTTTRKGRLSQELIGVVELHIEAKLHFSDDPDIEFEKILWNGADILPMLDHLPAADELMQHFTNAAYAFIYDVIVPQLKEAI